MGKEPNIAVIGLGFVGLPLALSFAMRGCNVVGVDVNYPLIQELNQGVTHHLEYYGEKSIGDILREELGRGTFRATVNPEDARECNAYVITVGIPVEDGIVNFAHLDSAIAAVGRILKTGDLVLLRSTVVPGTTEKRVLPLLEQCSGLRGGFDFHLAYASERIAEGKAFEEFENMPTVVGGINKASVEAAEKVLKIITSATIHQAMEISIVETAKVMENIARDVNIALANEFAMFARGLGIDIFEVINMANTHKRVNILSPGPGVGGYCIPNAYYYLVPEARKNNVELNLLRTARVLNDQVPHQVVNMVKQKLVEYDKAVKGAKIAVLGLAMKDFSNDDRISPAVQIVEMLLREGANVAAFDPAVPTKRRYKVETLEECIDGADVVLILARQHAMEIAIEKLRPLMKTSAIIIDTRNCIDKDEAFGLGLDVVGL